jgi:hypothetical protein
MPITLACTCGSQISVPETYAGKVTLCPGCGQAVQVPAMGLIQRPPFSPEPTATVGQHSVAVGSGLNKRRNKPLALLAASAGLVLIVAGIVAILNRMQTTSEPERALTEPERQAREKLNNQPKPKEQAIVQLPITETKTPESSSAKKEKKPRTPQEPKPAPPPPIPEIVRAEPAKPYQGGILTIQLKNDKPLAFQYRTGPKEDWKPVKDGRIVLSKLTGPKLIVEFRALDDKGKPSEILSRTWDLLPKMPIIAGKPLLLEWKLKQGDVLFQQLRVVQKPNYSILGVSFNSMLQYTVLSSFTVEKAGPEGLQVKQKVEAAQLVQADPLTQGILAPAVLKLPGTTFTIHLNPRMEVTKFTAGAKPFQMANLLGGQGLQLASLLDQDGWKEMAELTFFQPNRTLEKNQKWSRKMTHNWGALGSWAGQIHYAYAGKEKGIHKVAYGLDLAYQAPKANGMLPIANATFKPQVAGGLILFDAERGKVVEAQERFHVRGRLILNLLGQKSPVDIDEDQLFHIRIWERDPRRK